MAQDPERVRRMAGLFELYSLNSISQGPKSGYDIIKEIREKSRGNIIASKGSIYPILEDLALRGMVHSGDASARGRKVVSMTPAGRKYLRELSERKRCVRQKTKYIPFLLADVKGMHSDLDQSILKLTVLADDCPKKNRAKVKALLEDCRKKIEALE